jgi:hypothetical protein
VAATKVTIGNGRKALFWEASRIDGQRPKDIAPLIFQIPKRKKCTVQKALEGEFWVSQINTEAGLSLEHIIEYNKLWGLLQAVHLEPNSLDFITWKLTNDGCCSSKSA